MAEKVQERFVFSLAAGLSFGAAQYVSLRDQFGDLPPEWLETMIRVGLVATAFGCALYAIELAFANALHKQRDELSKCRRR